MRDQGARWRTVVAVTGIFLALCGLLAVPAVVDPGAAAAATSDTPPWPGYWMASSSGQIYQVSTPNFGDLRYTRLTRPVVGGAPSADGLGYWMVASDGGVFAYGDAGFHGSAGNMALVKPVVGMAADTVTGGYWLVASDGGIFNYSAPFRGSAGNLRLVKPIVGMASTPDGNGYWLVASDGGVFAYGDAGFYGSLGGMRLNKPIVGMASTPDGRGYWLVASDGGIFNFGDARFYGSAGNLQLWHPVVGMSASPDGKGYWLTSSDGGVFNFGDAPFLGVANLASGAAPIVSLFSTAHGYPFPPGSTGYDISQWQCGSIPAQHQTISIVQVSGGRIDGSPNPCYQQEAAWAGVGLSSYIFLDELPSPVPSYASSGCNGNLNCESYAFGRYWAEHWVSYSRSLGISPSLWWLDVEVGYWADRPQSSNANVVAGAVAGLRSVGVVPGLYSTHLQWGEITGNLISYFDIPLWVPGASTLSDAQTMCTSPNADHAPFAGGTTVLIQYGYDGSSHPYDQDYACR